MRGNGAKIKGTYEWLHRSEKALPVRERVGKALDSRIKGKQKENKSEPQRVRTYLLWCGCS